MWVLKIVLFLETMLMKTTATNLLTLSTSPSQATTPTLLHTHHTMPMPTTRSQWVEFMADKGVKIPSSWSLLQIKAHWGELQSEHYQPATLEMDAQIAALKRASRKKGDLQDFLTKEGVGFLPNHTIAQLYNLGEKHIYQMFEPVAGEKMNFGEHADLIPRCPGQVPGLCLMGHHHHEGGDSMRMEAQKVCNMGNAGTAWSIACQATCGTDRGQQPCQQEAGIGSKLLPDLVHPVQDPGGGEHGAAREDLTAREGESRSRAHEHAQQDEEGDLSEEVRVLSEDTAVFLAKGWEPRKNPLSQGWSTLTHHGRPLLMELACFPDSVLGSEVEKRYGKGSCIRISDWNGGDLETPEGVHTAHQNYGETAPTSALVDQL